MQLGKNILNSTFFSFSCLKFKADSANVVKAMILFQNYQQIKLWASHALKEKFTRERISVFLSPTTKVLSYRPFSVTLKPIRSQQN